MLLNARHWSIVGDWQHRNACTQTRACRYCLLYTEATRSTQYAPQHVGNREQQQLAYHLFHPCSKISWQPMALRTSKTVWDIRCSNITGTVIGKAARKIMKCVNTQQVEWCQQRQEHHLIQIEFRACTRLSHFNNHTTFIDSPSVSSFWRPQG